MWRVSDPQQARQGGQVGDGARGHTSFDRWRHVYNRERPHDAIEMQVPIERYTPSQRSFPQALPPVEETYSPET